MHFAVLEVCRSETVRDQGRLKICVTVGKKLHQWDRRVTFFFQMHSESKGRFT